jgi:Domain of unknown function (DUF6647)
MRKFLVCCAALVSITAAGSVRAQDGEDRALLSAVEQHDIRVPGTDYRLILGGVRSKPGAAVRDDLLSAIGTWLSLEFDLTGVHRQPRIEIVPAARLAVLRFPGLLADAQPNLAAPDAAATQAARDTLAVYSDASETIYLPEGWTGGTPAELSVLVHEMVHHAQNLLGLKYGCPQEREQLAYLAQERWLGLFGRSLESEFELDPMTLLVRTKCQH